MPSNEALSAIAFFIVALVMGFVGYKKQPQVVSPPNTQAATVVSAAIGMGWLERDQAERLLAYVERQAKATERCAHALEKLADEDAHEMKDKIDQLMDTMRENERRLRGIEGMRSRRPRRGA